MNKISKLRPLCKAQFSVPVSWQLKMSIELTCRFSGVDYCRFVPLLLSNVVDQVEKTWDQLLLQGKKQSGN